MTTIGVLGGRWRATVTAWGAVSPWDGSTTLDWHVAAEDRWHSPEHESAVRQTRLDGVPVVETRLRVPGGDVLHRCFAVADGGGMTLVELINESSAAVAVALTRNDLLTTTQAPNRTSIDGISLPETSMLLPIGHGASVVAALRHQAPAAGSLAVDRSSHESVVRGWRNVTDRAGRFVLSDAEVHTATADRCELALAGPADPTDDPIEFLLGIDQMVRMGEPAEPWTVDAGAAAERIGRSWADDHRLAEALDAAARVFIAAGDRRATADLQRLRERLDDRRVVLASARSDAESPASRLCRLEQRFVNGDGELFPGGIDESWLGVGVEAHGIPIGRHSQLSLALRWHGARPAVLWDIGGAPHVLTSPILAPDWHTNEQSGDALWPAPPGSTPPVSAPTADVAIALDIDQPGSFS